MTYLVTFPIGFLLLDKKDSRPVLAQAGSYQMERIPNPISVTGKDWFEIVGKTCGAPESLIRSCEDDEDWELRVHVDEFY